jgi:hypothetical protein
LKAVRALAAGVATLLIGDTVLVGTLVLLWFRWLGLNAADQ